MIQRVLALALVMLLGSGGVQAQQLFPGTLGEALIDSLRLHYKPGRVLSYNNAREEMYSDIDNDNGIVRGVYTGTEFSIDPNSSNPRSDANNVGMNCEHTWPQSLGASGDARSDMHHLFPTRVQANSARGNDPFGEVTGSATWYCGTQQLGSAPATGADLCSEDTSSLFEPPEAHKGNTARAMFYFYTMYREQSSSSFFDEQKEVLRDWHRLDTADAAERTRSTAIAVHQDGKENPFVLDETLVLRAYFPEQYVSTEPLPASLGFELEVFPNPAQAYAEVRLTVPDARPVTLVLFDLLGREVRKVTTAGPAATVRLRLEELPNGLYFVQVQAATGTRTHTLVKAA